MATTKNMVQLAGGSFRMGSERFYPEERPVREVTVEGFWIDRHPVTVAEFRRFVNATGHVTWAEHPPDPGDYPNADADDLVPYKQSVAMETALTSANVAVKLFRVPGGVHGPNFGAADKPHAQFQEVLRETTDWLDRYLRKTGSTP